ncbi:hypothetical protein [Corynebacterium pseudopelargi]|uniref:Uncharacterized protein n=1 Tax=Corynebacterium pseudopelargi TaxID=2080757 RepID=A0A3G6ISU6_9CORY|nr:hypothetical protein [Corynebacterium pseudopelargi]AZA08712.1 hypothetical protein CPPEL_02905 [Corynebacterium pseudopelargi]
MQLNEQEARQLIRTSIALHQELEHKKHSPPPQKEKIGHTPPHPGPRTPGGRLTDISIDLATNLAELIRDLAHRVTPGRELPAEAIPLLRWLQFNLQAAMQQDFIQDVLDEIEQQRKQLTGLLQPAEPATQSAKTFNTATAVLQVLQMHGHLKTREDLRNWANRGYISRVKDRQGRSLYCAAEAIQHIEHQRCTAKHLID